MSAHCSYAYDEARDQPAPSGILHAAVLEAKAKCVRCIDKLGGPSAGGSPIGTTPDTPAAPTADPRIDAILLLIQAQGRQIEAMMDQQNRVLAATREIDYKGSI